MYRKEIEQYIEAHEQEMMEDIFTLCRINSEKIPYEEGMPYGCGATTAPAEALALAERYGFSITNYDNYMGTADMNDKERQLGILAHLDVAPAGEGWKETEPFEPILKDGLLLGRSIADDKEPVVAALCAMRAMKELGVPLSKSVRLVPGTDEECGSSDTEHYCDVGEGAPMTFSPDTDFPVTNMEKGCLETHLNASFEPSVALPRLVAVNTGIKANVVPGKAQASVKGFKISVPEAAAEETEKETGVGFSSETADGVADSSIVNITAVGGGAHVAFLESGNNALTELLTLFQNLPSTDCAQTQTVRRLLALVPHGDTTGEAMGIAMKDEISDRPTLALSMLKVTDSSLDGVFDSRCPACATGKSVLYVVRDQLATIRVALENKEMTKPHYVDGDFHFMRALLRVYEECIGLEDKCQCTGDGTYIHSLKSGVAFGATLPGTENRMHDTDEFTVLEELVIGAKIFTQVIMGLCSQWLGSPRILGELSGRGDGIFKELFDKTKRLS